MLSEDFTYGMCGEIGIPLSHPTATNTWKLLGDICYANAHHQGKSF